MHHSTRTPSPSALAALIRGTRPRTCLRCVGEHATEECHETPEAEPGPSFDSDEILDPRE